MLIFKWLNYCNSCIRLIIAIIIKLNNIFCTKRLILNFTVAVDKVGGATRLDLDSRWKHISLP